MIRMVSGLGALLFAVLTASAQQSERFSGDPAAGRAIALRWCVGCHTLPDRAAGSDVAPSFRSIGRDPSKNPDHLRGFLSHPHWPMPPLQLSRTEIENVIAYLQELGQAKE